jgi:hypothetical protein
LTERLPGHNVLLMSSTITRKERPPNHPLRGHNTKLVTLFLVALSVFVLASCSLPGGTTVEETPATITLEGTLEQLESSCPYLKTAQGRVYLIFDTNLELLENPMRVLSAGEELATLGDKVRILGPNGFGETLCGPGVPQLVEQIQRIP